MRPSDDPASTEPAYDHIDHVVVGAGLSGLAYAWRRRREGRRVLVLERTDALPVTPPAVLLGAAPYLERLLEALPGAGTLTTATCGPFLVWTPGGLRSATPSLLRRLRRRPGSLAAEVRARLERRTPDPQGPLRVLAGGQGALRAALLESLGSVVQFGRPATRALPRQGATGLAHVETATGRLAAHEVVLDVWSGAQADLLGADAAEHADVLRAVPYAHVAACLVEAAPGRLPPVAGIVRTADSPGRMRSALFVSNLLPPTDGPAEVLVQLAGPGIVGLSDATTGRIAQAELDRAVGRGVAGSIRGVRRLCSPRPEPGHRGRLAALAGDLQGRSIRLLGSAVMGEELDRLASAGIPVAGPLPAGTTVA